MQLHILLFSSINSPFTTRSRQVPFACGTSRYLITNKEGKKKCKCKTIPLQAWTGPEGPRKLSLPNLKTINT
jgi:hypothetical protein